MELEQFEKAKEISKEKEVLLRLISFCVNSSTYVELNKLDSSNNWDSLRLPNHIKEEVLDNIKKLVSARIKELEQQFKDL